MDDIRAVMDAVGSERAAIFGWSEGVRLSLLFAATYPRPGVGVDRLRRACRTETGSGRGVRTPCVRSPKDASRVSAIRWELS